MQFFQYSFSQCYSKAYIIYRTGVHCQTTRLPCSSRFNSAIMYLFCNSCFTSQKGSHSTKTSKQSKYLLPVTSTMWLTGNNVLHNKISFILQDTFGNKSELVTSIS